MCHRVYRHKQTVMLDVCAFRSCLLIEAVMYIVNDTAGHCHRNRTNLREGSLTKNSTSNSVILSLSSCHLAMDASLFFVVLASGSVFVYSTLTVCVKYVFKVRIELCHISRYLPLSSIASCRLYNILDQVYTFSRICGNAFTLRWLDWVEDRV